jgi:hypothetical protein
MSSSAIGELALGRARHHHGALSLMDGTYKAIRKTILKMSARHRPQSFQRL